jgi:hypothetical protein
LVLNRSITFQECKAALDAAFSALITKVTGQELLPLTVLAVVNTEIIMEEMARRGE